MENFSQKINGRLYLVGENKQILESISVDYRFTKPKGLGMLITDPKPKGFDPNPIFVFTTEEEFKQDLSGRLVFIASWENNPFWFCSSNSDLLDPSCIEEVSMRNPKIIKRDGKYMHVSCSNWTSFLNGYEY